LQNLEVLKEGIEKNYRPVKKDKITSGTKEWADSNVNCISGCSNDCRYCYAKKMAIRFGRKSEDTWKQMEIREHDVEKNYRKRQGRVMFPTSHDITPKKEVKEACFKVLKKLLESENEVLVTLKPAYEVIKDICKKFEFFNELIQFRFTITSMNDDLLCFWEPGAPRFEERLESLKYAYTKGFKTSVSIEPFLDRNPVELVELIQPFITESIWIGKMNYIRRNNLSKYEKKYYNQVRKNYKLDNIKKIVKKLTNNELIMFKDSIRKLF
jgi:DNA repair photolyase